MKYSSKELAAVAATMKRLGNEVGKSFIKLTISTTVDILREMGFHFSDYLKAVAEYAENQSSVDPDTQQTRSTVASLLETAAIEAETEGRELP